MRVRVSYPRSMKLRQLSLELPFHGGKRQGAGRKPKGLKARVSHQRRPHFPARDPVHVTMRMRSGVGYLRGYRLRRAIEGALREAKERFGLRVIHYSIQGTRLHLLVEADGPISLTRGAQGLAVRIARAINRVQNRRGKVFADRYHSRPLATRREVSNAVKYILENFRHHVREDFAPAAADPCSSAKWLSIPLAADSPIVSPRTWLVRHAFGPRGELGGRWTPSPFT